jgi:hypothetical protein
MNRRHTIHLHNQSLGHQQYYLLQMLIGALTGAPGGQNYVTEKLMVA